MTNAIYTHPVTPGITYRLNKGVFELPAKKAFFCSEQLWKKSGMKSGFRLQLAKVKNLDTRQAIVRKLALSLLQAR